VIEKINHETLRVYGMTNPVFTLANLLDKREGILFVFGNTGSVYG